MKTAASAILIKAIVVLGEGSGLSIRIRWVRVPSMAPSFVVAVSRSPINIKLRLQQQIYFHMNKPY